MASLRGTETEKNLMRGFAGESQARNRYTFYAKVANEQGYPLIENIFSLTAAQEHAHAKAFYKYLVEELNGEEIEIDASFPVAYYSEDTLKNLQAAVAGETHEHEEVYPAFAQIAKDEGFPKVAATFKMIAEVEALHAKRFASIATDIENGTLFKKSEPVAWHCLYCGHIHFGAVAPAKCPICLQGQGFFEVGAKY